MTAAMEIDVIWISLKKFGLLAGLNLLNPGLIYIIASRAGLFESRLTLTQD